MIPMARVLHLATCLNGFVTRRNSDQRGEARVEEHVRGIGEDGGTTGKLLGDHDQDGHLEGHSQLFAGEQLAERART